MAGALTQGVDFNCNASICYGIGLVDAQFRALQTTINGFAAIGSGFAPITVDGFIGDETVTAANAAAQLAGAPSPGTTHEDVAANALALTAQLQSMLQDLALVGAITPASPTAPPTPTAAMPSDALAPPPPEIASVIRETASACLASRSSPACTRARLMCKSVRGTQQATAAGVDEICAATRVPIWIWVLAGTGAVAATVGAFWLVRRRRQRQAGRSHPRSGM